MMNDSNEIKEAAGEVTYYAQLSYERHLVRAAGGNVSVRLSAGNGFLITPSGVSLRSVNPSDLVQIDSEGTIISVSGGNRPSKEYRMHTAIYLNRPEVNAVVHVHPPYATGFATGEREFPMMTASARLKLVRAPTVPYADPGSAILAGYVADVLRSPDSQKVKAILLASHGLLAFDDTLSHAFEIAELVEETAHVAFVALTLRSLEE